MQAVFDERLKDQSIAVPLMCCAADMLTVPSWKQVVLVGDKASAEYSDMVTAVYASYDPNRTVNSPLFFCLLSVSTKLLNFDPNPLKFPFIPVSEMSHFTIVQCRYRQFYYIIMLILL